MLTAVFTLLKTYWLYLALALTAGVLVWGVQDYRQLRLEHAAALQHAAEMELEVEASRTANDVLKKSYTVLATDFYATAERIAKAPATLTRLVYVQSTSAPDVLDPLTVGELPEVKKLAEDAQACVTQCEARVANLNEQIINREELIRSLQNSPVIRTNTITNTIKVPTYRPPSTLARILTTVGGMAVGTAAGYPVGTRGMISGGIIGGLIGAVIK